MKLLKTRAEDGQINYIVMLETMFERVMYDISSDYKDETFRAFDNAMYCQLNIHDREVVYYLNVNEDEQEPVVGETFELDGIEYERIA